MVIKSRKDKRNIVFMTIILLIVLPALLILNITLTRAATVSGNVYGPSLELLKETVIKVNSTPEQTIVAKDGSYSFELPLGVYKIEAKYYGKDYNLYDKENINLDNNGSYIIDLILLEPAEGDVFINDSLLGDISSMLETKNNLSWMWWLLSIPIVVIVIFVFIILTKKKTKKEIEPDEVKQRILEIIKKEKRIKQKDLRKTIGMSEAKISLVITELEDEGKVKKIKKGRGNIIIYQHN